MCLKLALGASAQQILEETDTPLLKHLQKGFRASADIKIVSNLKNAISELTKSEDPEEQEAGNAFLKIVSVFLLSITGKVSLDFDDFDEIADHPMAEKFMVSFEKLFE